MAETPKKKGVLEPIIALLRWAWNRLERTILLALKIVFPSRFISPLGFLGMLTLVVFIILGVTGALLLFYYQPAFGNCAEGAPPEGCNLAFESVRVIDQQVNWGFMMRNIHYHASNAMVLLAVMHMFYQYFSGRYKLRYEMLWVTGVILGVVTVIEAYTGYDLIFNIRGQLAINIGRTLTLATPVIGADIVSIVFGFSPADLTLRFYALHVFILPIIMLALMAVHLPRNLVLDIPVATAITGIIFIIGGLFPVEVGVKFTGAEAQITFPEWYFSSLYAFLRVAGVSALIGGIIIPTVFVLIFLIVPFFDRGKRIAMIDRPFWTALGVASLGQIAIVTVWGFRADNIFEPLEVQGQLIIDPALLFGSMLVATALSYGVVYAFVRWKRAKVEMLRAQRKPTPIRRVQPYILSKGEVYSIMGGLLLLQGFLDFALFRAILNPTLKNLALIQIGVVLVSFAAAAHIYRVSSRTK